MYVPTISPSQLSTYTMCPRKWAFGKLDKVRSPSSPAAELGSAVHKVLEDWLRDGTVPPPTQAGKIAKALIPKLPAPGVGQVESKYELVRGDVTYSGRIDLVYKHGAMPVIHDHKTTSSLRWAKTPRDLLTDFQSVQYAAAAQDTDGMRGKSVMCEWGYVTTKGTPQTRLVKAGLSYDHTQKQMDDQDCIAAELVHLYKEKPKASEVYADDSACNAFGGCYYRAAGMCDGTNKKGIEPMGLADKLRKRKAAATPAEETKTEPVQVETKTEEPKVNPPKTTTKRKGLNKKARADKTEEKVAEVTQLQTTAKVAVDAELRDRAAIAVFAAVMGRTDVTGETGEKLAKQTYGLVDALLSGR